MKHWVFPAVVLVAFGFSARAAINSASQDVLKMAQSGVSEQVIEGYVNNSSATFNLNADDIVYLQQNGVPQPVISTMISHDSSLAQGQTQPLQGQTQPYEQQQPQNYEQVPPDQTAPQANPPGSYASAYVGQDQPVVQVAPDQAPPQVSSFYDVLAPYGNWIYLEGYGWCWQPNEVRATPTWQPYCDNGNWVYCDDGWYWHSGYNWGWAPFHYGRWWHANCGWVWFPDTIWAPSWVCWRSDSDFCGWAPLPPSGFVGYGRPGFHFGVNFNIGLGANFFTFVHLGDIFHGNFRRHEIPRSEVTRVFNRTRIINNVTIVNNNYARNPGISRQIVERAAGPVRVAHVRTSTSDPRVNRPGVVGSGSQINIVRPAKVSPERITTPIVAHRVPANARSVPATPPQRMINNQRNGNQRQTTVSSPNRTSTAPGTSYTERYTEPLRTPRANEIPRTTSPRSRELPTPNVSEVPRTSRTTEVPRSNNPRVNETPRPSTPRTAEVPHPTQAPRLTETPRPAPTPRVTETPRPTPTPRVTEVPRATPRSTTPQSEIHRAYPEPAPRVEAPRQTIREPSGSRAPVFVPRQETPRPPVTAPPSARPYSAPGIERHASPPPGLERRSSEPDGRRDH